MLTRALSSLDRKALVVISAFVLLVFAMALTFAPQRTSATVAAARTPVSLESTAKEVKEEAREEKRIEVDRHEVLWLARGIYSETKKPHEQEMVAWVIRNRLETEYRGKDSYREVVLDPWQFSAFNYNSPVRRFYSTLTENSSSRGWKVAVGIAERVATADTSERPFHKTTRHFYSERSMVGGRKPAWALRKSPVPLENIDARRFRFYAGVN